MKDRGWFHARALLVALFLIALVTGARSVRPVIAKGEPYSYSYRLSMLSPTDPRSLLALDPGTLADRAELDEVMGPVLLHPRIPPMDLVSDDGSTIAIVVVRAGAVDTARRKDVTVRVFDTATGVERAKFHPGARIDSSLMQLSSDGRELYGPMVVTSQVQPSRWVSLDSGDGHILHRVRLPLQCCAPMLYDATGAKLYALDSGAGVSDGPTTPTLRSYDAKTGRSLGSTHLDGVLTGIWDTGRAGNEGPIMGMWLPAWSLSRDGRRIAVVRANDDTLQVIRTDDMQVVETQRLSQPSDALSRFLSWSGIAPISADAKELEGVSLQSTFSPDGRLLFLSGYRSQFAADGTYHMYGLGMRLVDVGNGTLLASLLPDQQVVWDRSAPDGSALFTLSSPIELENQSVLWTLSRIDLTTHQITAQRTFKTYPNLLITKL